jgi:hypothetical protein
MQYTREAVMPELKGSVFLLAAMLAMPLAAEPPKIDLPARIAANSLPFAYDAATGLSGPGAAFLEKATADSQFVLLGEDHYLRETPLFSAAFYRMLHARHGFRHLVVEQDRYAMEDVLAPARRGDAVKIGQWVGRYPGSFEFGSDQDIELLALAGRLDPGPAAICGIEQAVGAPRYLEELARRAPNARLRAEVDELRTLALKLDAEPTYSVNFLIAPGITARLEKLRADFAAKPDSRADEMLLGLVRSSEIFGYYRRAEAGEPVGLYNNTVRETWFKRLFMRCYRQMAARGALPKAMFKFGANHMFRGKNPTQAFPIGNFAHEFAIANGHEAYGVFILPLIGKGYGGTPPEIRVMLPAEAPSAPMVIDLRALRPLQRFLRASLKDSEATAFREIINGYDAIVLLPGESPATMKLSGLKPL